MKYYRLMNDKELEKVLRGETLNRKEQKQWFLEKNVFYFISEEDGGLQKLREIAMLFLNEEEQHLFIIEFESNSILEKTWNEDEQCYESICEFYSINEMYPTGYIKSPKDFDFEEWIWNPLVSGIPYFSTKRIKNDLSKSFNDRNYIADKILVKKEILNRRKNRWVKYSIR